MAGKTKKSPQFVSTRTTDRNKNGKSSGQQEEEEEAEKVLRAYKRVTNSPAGNKQS